MGLFLLQALAFDEKIYFFSSGAKPWWIKCYPLFPGKSELAVTNTIVTDLQKTGEDDSPQNHTANYETSK